MLPVNTPTAALVVLGGLTFCLVKVLLYVRASCVDGPQNRDLSSLNVHGRGHVRHPIALAVAHRELGPVAFVLGVSLLPRLVALLVTDEVVR